MTIAVRVRHTSDPRRPATGTARRRDHAAGVSHVDVRAGRARREQGIRVRAQARIRRGRRSSERRCARGGAHGFAFASGMGVPRLDHEAFPIRRPHRLRRERVRRNVPAVRQAAAASGPQLLVTSTRRTSSASRTRARRARTPYSSRRRRIRSCRSPISQRQRRSRTRAGAAHRRQHVRHAVLPAAVLVSARTSSSTRPRSI